MNTEPKFHFFGSTAFNWAVGATRQEVLASLARRAGAEQIKRNVKASGGLYAWTCRVDAPQSTRYDISFYQPQGVHISKTMEFNLQNKHGHVTLIEKEEAA